MGIESLVGVIKKKMDKKKECQQIYSSLIKTSASMASRIIRTDNPDPNSWVKSFLRNEERTY